MSALGALVAALVLAAAPDPFKDLPPGTPVRTYVVQPGDSPWSIAAEFFGNGDKYPLIYKFNGYVGRPPYLLSPGQVLRLPVLGSGPEAQIEWLKRDVKAKPPRALDWLDAREKMNLWRLYRVSTGDESAAHIVFEDTSDLRLREQALLVIYGASATAAATERKDKHEVVLEQGTLQGGLAKLDADARPLVVKTPSGDVDILGKLTQIQAEAFVSAVSAFDGAARVSAKGASVEVAEGQGTIVEKGKKPEPARPLPKAPAWDDPSPALVVALPGGPAPMFEARWKPVDGAASYRVELAVNGDFKQVAYDAEVGSGVTTLRLEALGFGSWGVRVSTRDKNKLESKAGVSRSILVVGATASKRVSVKDGRVEAVGLIELRAPDGVTVAADSGASGPSVRLGAGSHQLTWSGNGAEQKGAIEVVDVTGELSVSGEPLTRNGSGGVAVKVTTKDARGEPAFLPGLVLETTAHGELATTVAGDSASAEVPALAPDGPARVKVRARWAGGVLAERELDVVGAERRSAYVPPFEWREAATVPYRRVRGLAQPAAPPSAQSVVALETGLADVSDVGLGLELTLSGEAAFLDGALALDAGLLFQGIHLTGDVDPQSAPGDAWLGIRWRALGGSTFELAPYLQVAIPVGRGESARVLGLEPGLVARLHLGPTFLDLRAAALVRAGQASYDTLGFDGLAAFTWGPMSLSYRGVLADGEVLSTIGLGAAVPIGRVRLGMALGYGIDAPTRAVLGGFSGRITLDLGL